MYVFLYNHLESSANPSPQNWSLVGHQLNTFGGVCGKLGSSPVTSWACLQVVQGHASFYMRSSMTQMCYTLLILSGRLQKAAGVIVCAWEDVPANTEQGNTLGKQMPPRNWQWHKITCFIILERSTVCCLSVRAFEAVQRRLILRKKKDFFFYPNSI